MVGGKELAVGTEHCQQLMRRCSQLCGVLPERRALAAFSPVLVVPAAPTARALEDKEIVLAARAGTLTAVVLAPLVLAKVGAAAALGLGALAAHTLVLADGCPVAVLAHVAPPAMLAQGPASALAAEGPRLAVSAPQRCLPGALLVFALGAIDPLDLVHAQLRADAVLTPQAFAVVLAQCGGLARVTRGPLLAVRAEDALGLAAVAGRPSDSMPARPAAQAVALLARLAPPVVLAQRPATAVLAEGALAQVRTDGAAPAYPAPGPDLLVLADGRSDAFFTGVLDVVVLAKPRSSTFPGRNPQKSACVVKSACVRVLTF